MAFIPGSIAEKYTSKGAGTSKGFVPGSIADKYKPASTSGGFVPGSVAGKSGMSSKNFDTSAGLYEQAVQAGLKKQADSALRRQEGEKTKEIFSGGFLSDIFDTLNALQYGVTGMLKGKTFSEGVKTRQSFSDQDALGDKGIPGIITGILLDIAVDPLTYIAPATVVKKVPLLEKTLKLAREAAFGKKVIKPIETGIEGLSKSYEGIEGGTEAGKYFASKLSWSMGKDPVFINTIERGTKNIAVTTEQVVDLGRSISKLEPETAAKILQRGADNRFIRTPISKLSSVLKPAELLPVTKIYNLIDNLGAEAVDLGLLSKAKFEENIGEYIKNAYTEYELANSKKIFGSSKIGIQGIKQRVEGLGVEEMAAKGQIDNPAYLLFKSAVDLAKDVGNAKIFKEVSERFGTNVAQEGFTKLPTGIRLGELAGKYVPNHMAEYLQEIISPSSKSIGKDLVANFKFFKVIMNPATHARNIMSNRILNYWKLGMNPLDPRTIKADLTALKEITKGSGKWTTEAKPLGYSLDTFASAEMKGLLDSPEALGFAKTLGSKWQSFKKTLGGLYQKEENHAKLTAYIYQRTVENLKPEEAWKAAESATFNYAQVTPFIRKLRESLFGFPFITFTAKATPAAIETALKHPQRIGVIGKIKQGIENLSDIKETDRERASEAPWIRDGFYVKLPMKDKDGRSVYFDMTYILPFGDLVAGNYFETKVDTKTGLPENKATALSKKSPFLNLLSELHKNQDFYGNKIWKDSDSTDQQLKDLMRHLAKSYLPPLAAEQIPGGYNQKGERVQRGFVKTLSESQKDSQQRNTMEELLKNVGLKVQPIDADIQETYQEWNKKKALQTLLLENNQQSDVSEFRRLYIPKK